MAFRPKENPMKFFRNRRGQGTTEYVIILAILAALIVAGFPKIKQAITTKMNDANTNIGNAK